MRSLSGLASSGSSALAAEKRSRRSQAVRGYGSGRMRGCAVCHSFHDVGDLGKEETILDIYINIPQPSITN